MKDRGGQKGQDSQRRYGRSNRIIEPTLYTGRAWPAWTMASASLQDVTAHLGVLNGACYNVSQSNTADTADTGARAFISQSFGPADCEDR